MDSGLSATCENGSGLGTDWEDCDCGLEDPDGDSLEDDDGFWDDD